MANKKGPAMEAPWLMQQDDDTIKSCGGQRWALTPILAPFASLYLSPCHIEVAYAAPLSTCRDSYRFPNR